MILTGPFQLEMFYDSDSFDSYLDKQVYISRLS